MLFVQDLTESNRLRGELLESQQRYQAIVESVEGDARVRVRDGPQSGGGPGNADPLAILDAARVAVLGVGPDGAVTDWNDLAAEMLGWSRAEVIGTPSSLLVPEAQRDAWRDLLEPWLASNDHRPPEGPAKGLGLGRDGRSFPVEINISRDTRIECGVLVFFRDQSERRRLQSALLQSQQRYRAIVENIEDGYYEVTPYGKYTFVNEAFCKSFGQPMDEILGQNYKQFYDSDVAPKLHAAFVKVWETGIPLQSFEFPMKRRDGVTHFVEDSVSLKRDRTGRQVGFLGIRRDITGRKLNEKAMQASESRWRDLFERASDLVYTCDLNGLFTSINQAGEQITGYSRYELIGIPSAALLAPGSQIVNSKISEDLRGGKASATYEADILTRTGRAVSLELSVSVLYESGKPVGLLGMGRDISARKRAERFEQGRASILEDVARDRSLLEVLAGLAALVECELPESACSVVFFEKDGLQRNTALRLVAGPSLPPDLKRGIDVSLERNTCLETTVFRSEPEDAHSVVSTDIRQHPSWEAHRELALAGGWRGCWSAPIFSGAGEALGSVAVLCPRCEPPDREERNFLVQAAELASLTIEQRNLTSQLAFQAKHDSLTGLPNRLLFEERLGQAIADCARQGGQVAVIWLDLDRFKNINDTLGHWVGDLLLLEVSKRFLASVASQGTLARLGGDEFALVIPGGAGVRQDAARLAEALLANLELTFPICGHHLHVTASIGIGIYPEDGIDAASLLRSADQAMYSAKRKEQGQFHFYLPEMGRHEAEKADIESQLRAALVHGGFEIHYQPQFTPSGELVALEALLRFRHPVQGMIPPGRFIPIAEESGLIIPLGEWVLRNACIQAVEWERRGYQAVRLAVNVSALQFAQTDFAEITGRVLAETGMAGDRLELELTETVVMSKVAESIRQMQQLRALGVSLAIDDFGTGYSSLNYLHRLEVDRLKIDRSFVNDLASSVTTLPVVQAIVALAGSLKQEVVAEGVETETQLQMLRAAGCHILQGYLLSRPVPAQEVEKLLTAVVSAGVDDAEVQCNEQVASQLHALIRVLEPVGAVMPAGF